MSGFALPQNNFERGQKDEFEVIGTDVGEVQRVVIGHDNSGNWDVTFLVRVMRDAAAAGDESRGDPCLTVFWGY